MDKAKRVSRFSYWSLQLFGSDANTHPLGRAARGSLSCCLTILKCRCTGPVRADTRMPSPPGMSVKASPPTPLFLLDRQVGCTARTRSPLRLRTDHRKVPSMHCTEALDLGHFPPWKSPAHFNFEMQSLAAGMLRSSERSKGRGWTEPGSTAQQGCIDSGR